MGRMLYQFFGFLWSGKFTCPLLDSYTLTMLLVGDVVVESHAHPSLMTLHLHQSKTNVYGVRVTIYLTQVPGPVCPVKALLPYLVLWDHFQVL